MNRNLIPFIKLPSFMDEEFNMVVADIYAGIHFNIPLVPLLVRERNVIIQCYFIKRSADIEERARGREGRGNGRGSRRRGFDLKDIIIVFNVSAGERYGEWKEAIPYCTELASNDQEYGNQFVGLPTNKHMELIYNDPTKLGVSIFVNSFFFFSVIIRGFCIICLI